VSWLTRLLRGPSKPVVFEHDAPDLEAKLPVTVASRPLVRWSVAGENFWKLAGGDRVKSALVPELATLGLSPADIELAVAGREDTSHDPPYIIWALRFGHLTGADLEGPIPSSLAMDVMNVDANQGDNWRDDLVGGRKVFVGNSAMVSQDRHHRGIPYIYLTKTCIYALISDDAAWAEEAIRSLPMRDSG
jgi:hypothetical protein